MAYIVGVLEGDFDTFKQRFDADPMGRRSVAKGHTILRSVGNPNQFFVRVEFDSVDEAKAFADKVRGSNVFDDMDVKLPPTVAEVADRATY